MGVLVLGLTPPQDSRIQDHSTLYPRHFQPRLLILSRSPGQHLLRDVTLIAREGVGWIPWGGRGTPTGERWGETSSNQGSASDELDFG